MRRVAWSYDWNQRVQREHSRPSWCREVAKPCLTRALQFALPNLAQRHGDIRLVGKKVGKPLIGIGQAKGEFPDQRAVLTGMQIKTQFCRRIGHAPQIVIATNGKGFEQGGHEDSPDCRRAGKHQPRDIGLEIGAARPFAGDAGPIDGQFAIYRIDTIEFAVKTQKVAGYFDGAIMRAERHILCCDRDRNDQKTKCGEDRRTQCCHVLPP